MSNIKDEQKSRALQACRLLIEAYPELDISARSEVHEAHAKAILAMKAGK
jgi:hypothetical protein